MDFDNERLLLPTLSLEGDPSLVGLGLARREESCCRDDLLSTDVRRCRAGRLLEAETLDGLGLCRLNDLDGVCD